MDPSFLPSKDKELLWQSGEKELNRSVGPYSLHTDLSWSLGVATKVVIMAARVLLSSGAGIKFFLQWSRHSSSDFRRIAILPASFYDPFCATEGHTYRKFSNNCALKTYNSSHSEPRKLPPFVFEDIFQC